VHIDEQAVIFFACLIAAAILHEISHGVVALWFGDGTAKEAGRITLNPVPHIDPFGSIVLPAMGALTGIPVLAWAKPVPVNPARLRNPRRDMVWVSLAGPLTNFSLMTVAALTARFAYRNSTPVATVPELPLAIRVLFSFAVVNMFLGVFNLVPIPPLDGSALIERVLPAAWLPNWYKFRPYGLLVLFLLVFSTGIVSTFFDPLFNRLFDFVFR
jgi:Zn-dependent protease